MRMQLVLLLVTGCSSSASPATADAPRAVDAATIDGQVGVVIPDAPRGAADAPAVNCPLMWLEDGVPRCAPVPIGVFNPSKTDDTLDIAGVDISSGGTGIDFLVSGADPFAVPQTFTCENPQPHSIAEMTYTPPLKSGTATSCTVTVTQIGAVGGAHAQGTFSGVIAIDGGGTHVITNGSFDVARRQ